MFSNIKNFFETVNKNNKVEQQIFLDEDIYAVLSLLIEASKIDGKIDEKEISLINKILIDKFKLTSLKANQALEFVIDESGKKVEVFSDIKTILDSMDHNERISVIEMIWKVVLVDNHVDDFEQSLIRKICGLLHVSGAESSDAKKRAMR